MPFNSDSRVLSLIKNQQNKKAKSLIKKGRLYNEVDPSRNRLLHYAAEYGNVEIVQFLLDSGSNVNAINELRETPLLASVKSELPCKQVIETLLKAGADVHILSHKNESVNGMVQSSEWLNNDRKRFEILKCFLELAISLEKDFYNLSTYGSKETIKSLLQTDIDLRKPYTGGQTLVHMLAASETPGVIEELQGRNFNVDVRNDYRTTPLMYAAFYGKADTVEFLLSIGAEVEATDDENRTALCNAILAITDDGGYGDVKKTVQVLLKHGANTQVEFRYDSTNITIFDHLLNYGDEFHLQVMELVVAHLALQEVLGTTIADLIRSKIHSNHRLKSFLENCQQQVSKNIHPTITLFDLLTASERKLERYFYNEELASKLIDFKTEIEYFDEVLKKRFAKASRTVELRKTAGQIVCKLLKMNCMSYPFITSDIVSYFNEKDIECLISIQNELL